MLKNLQQTLKRQWQRIMSDSLHRNSMFLMGGTFIASGLGFLFWILCSRYYSAAQIGLAGSLIAATSLLTNLSFLGLNNTIVRYLAAAKNKSAHISTTIFISCLAALALSCIFLAGLHTFLPALTHGMGLWERAVIVGYVICAVASAMLDSLFVAERAAHVLFIKNSLSGLVKLGLPILFVSMGFFGIFVAVAITLCAGTIYSIAGAYRRGIRLQRRISRDVIKETRRYAAGNYLAGIFGAMPLTVTPMLVASVLGAQHAGYFYMPMMITTLLNVIPSASAQSLFAEASHDHTQLHAHIGKTIRGMMLLLIPAVVGVMLLGGVVLGVLGDSYAGNGSTVLQLLAVASIFGAINYVGDTVLNIRKRVGSFIFMNALNALLVVGSVFVMMRLWGLPGVGWGWLTGQAITMLVYLGIYGRQEWSALRSGNSSTATQK